MQRRAMIRAVLAGAPAAPLLRTLLDTPLPASTAEHKDRERAIRYSDVVSSFDFTPAEYKMWHVNKVYGWVGAIPNQAAVAAYIEKKRAVAAIGARMGSSINAFAGDRDWYGGSEWFQKRDPGWQQSVWRDVHGKLVIYPWIRPPDPWPVERACICSNHPLYLEKKFGEVDLAMEGKPDAFHIDDPLGTATVLRADPPGCFCRHCMEGFRDHLKKHVAPDKLKSLGIADLTAFDYAAYLRNRKKPIQQDELWRDFEDFQLGRAADNMGRLFERARQRRGTWIPVGANAPIVGSHIVFAPLLDFLAAEVGTDAIEMKFGAKPMLNYKMGEAMGIAVASTGIYKDWVRLFVHDIPDLVRGWVAESYAMGGNFIVPHKEWGMIQLPGEKPINIAYPGDPAKISPLYEFVRNFPELFDHYKPIEQVGLLYDYRASGRVFRGQEMPQTAATNPTALHEICLELGASNIQFSMLVAGAGPFRHELTEADLDRHELVIINEPLLVEGRQRELLEARERKGKAIRWRGIDSVRSRVNPWIATEPSGDIWVLPRVIPGRPETPLVCHVLNRRFDAKKEKLIPHEAVILRLHTRMFDGRRHGECKVYTAQRPPLAIPVHAMGDMVEVTLRNFELWSVLWFS